MELNSFDPKRKLQAETPITVLIIISLILTAICSLDNFTYYISSNGGAWEFHFSLFEDGIIDTIFSLLSYSLLIAPVILFAMYIFKYYKRFQATILIPIVLGLIAFTPLFNFIRDLAFGYGLSSILDLLVDLLVIVSFALATINALKGFSQKKCLIIAVSCGLLGEIVSFISFICYAGTYISDELYLYLFTWPLSIIGFSALYIALLLFVLKNNISVMVMKEKNTVTMSPEQSLRYLKEKLDLCMITEEEYQAQRADIIDKL